MNLVGITKYTSRRIGSLGFFGSGEAGMRILFAVQMCAKRGTFFAGLNDRIDKIYLATN